MKWVIVSISQLTQNTMPLFISPDRKSSELVSWIVLTSSVVVCLTLKHLLLINPHSCSYHWIYPNLFKFWHQILNMATIHFSWCLSHFDLYTFTMLLNSLKMPFLHCKRQNEAEISHACSQQWRLIVGLFCNDILVFDELQHTFFAIYQILTLFWPFQKTYLAL